MLFSIIIPAYNSSQYIRKALDSIKSQSFTDYELIVICDSCEDNTEEIAKEYGAITEAVNFHNDGPTRSRGVDLAQGEYLLFMDDDDWFLHEFALDLLSKIIEKKEHPELICFSFIWKGIGYAPPTGNGGSLYPAVWNKCWKREWVGETRFPKVHSISDFYFHKEMMAKAVNNDSVRIIMYDTPLYYYNFLREGSVSKIDADKNGEVRFYDTDEMKIEDEQQLDWTF